MSKLFLRETLKIGNPKGGSRICELSLAERQMNRFERVVGRIGTTCSHRDSCYFSVSPINAYVHLAASMYRPFSSFMPDFVIGLQNFADMEPELRANQSLKRSITKH